MSDYRKIMLEAFKSKAKPTMYLASKANVVITKATEFEIDIVRGKETYAVDIVQGAGSRSNDKSRFTTKVYSPLYYDESYTITAMELQKRIPGMTVYQAAQQDYSADLAALLTDKQALIQDKEIRAVEIMARDALFSGVITMHNGVQVDFKKKGTHDVNPGVKWNAANGIPLTNLEAACNLCREDGLVDDMVFELTVADDVVEALKANAQFVAKANLRHVQNVMMGMPQPAKMGAVFHGIFSAGPYTIELWSYPQRYEVPMGFGLAGEGTKKAYIPSGKALLVPKNGIRFDLVYGGIPQVVPQVDPILQGFGLNGSLTIVEGDYVPYAYVDWRKQCIEAGVRTNPLFIPHQIDGFVTLNTLI
jgi:hypothetical protein